MYTRSLSPNIVVRDDGTNIPNDPNNPDYRDYLAWVAKGNTVSPPLARPELAAIQQKADAISQELVDLNQSIDISSFLQMKPGEISTWAAGIENQPDIRKALSIIARVTIILMRKVGR